MARKAWNKGLSKDTDPRVRGYIEKSARTRLGKKLSVEHKEAIRKAVPRGETHPSWKGGRTIKKEIGDGYGYVLIRMPKHPYATKNGYVREHRLVMEKKIGRCLEPHEVVHHINGIKNDNRLKNLALYEKNMYGSHMKRLVCPDCGCKF